MRSTFSAAYPTTQQRDARSDQAKPSPGPSDKTHKLVESISQIIFKRTEPLRRKSEHQAKAIEALEQRVARLEAGNTDQKDNPEAGE